MSARNTTQLVMEIESHSVMSNSLQSHGYPVHGILQARLLESVPFPSPRDLPNPGVEPRSPALQVNYQLSHQRSPVIEKLYLIRDTGTVNIHDKRWIASLEEAFGSCLSPHLHLLYQ